MRIALIEDEPAIRQELTLLLQNALYEVTALDDLRMRHLRHLRHRRT